MLQLAGVKLARNNDRTINHRTRDFDMIYANPGQDGSALTYKTQYENYIGGQWVPPVDGEYFDDMSPVDGGHISRVPKSNSKDIDLAVAAATDALADLYVRGVHKDAWPCMLRALALDCQSKLTTEAMEKLETAQD